MPPTSSSSAADRRVDVGAPGGESKPLAILAIFGRLKPG